MSVFRAVGETLGAGLWLVVLRDMWAWHAPRLAALVSGTVAPSMTWAQAIVLVSFLVAARITLRLWLRPPNINDETDELDKITDVWCGVIAPVVVWVIGWMAAWIGHWATQF